MYIYIYIYMYVSLYMLQGHARPASKMIAIGNMGSAKAPVVSRT